MSLLGVHGDDDCDARERGNIAPDLRERLDLDDILNERDLTLTQTRYEAMAQIFESINATSLLRIAKKYPILLALESDQLLKAKTKLETSLPYVDMEYLIEQRASGVDLFLR